MMKFRSLFHFRDLVVYIRSHSFQLLTALAAGSFDFSRFGKIGLPNRSTQASLMFFFHDFEIFENSQMRGLIRKEGVLTDSIPRVNKFLLNRL